MFASRHRRALLAGLTALLVVVVAMQSSGARGASGGAGPLGLADVASVQRDVQMSLRMSTAGAWATIDLTSVPDRAATATPLPPTGCRRA